MGLTVEETVVKLKEQIADIIAEDSKFNDDLCLLLWLRSSKMSCDKAAKKIKEQYKWKKDNNYQNLANEAFDEDLCKFLKLYNDVTSKDGQPATAFDVGKLDFRGAMDALGREKLLRFWAQVFLKDEARILAFNKSQNPDVGTTRNKDLASVKLVGCTAVLDGEKFEAKQVQSFQLIRAYGEIVGSLGYFPVVYDHTFFIKTSRWMFYVLKLFRSMLERFGMKIDVFDLTDDKWKGTIYELIDPSELPEPIGTRRVQSESES